MRRVPPSLHSLRLMKGTPQTSTKPPVRAAARPKIISKVQKPRNTARNKTFDLLPSLFPSLPPVWGEWGFSTCCGVVTGMRYRSDCDGQWKEVTMDTDLGFWLVC